MLRTAHIGTARPAIVIAALLLLTACPGPPVVVYDEPELPPGGTFAVEIVAEDSIYASLVLDGGSEPVVMLTGLLRNGQHLARRDGGRWSQATVVPHGGGQGEIIADGDTLLMAYESSISMVYGSIDADTVDLHTIETPQTQYGRPSLAMGADGGLLIAFGVAAERGWEEGQPGAVRIAEPSFEELTDRDVPQSSVVRYPLAWSPVRAVVLSTSSGTLVLHADPDTELHESLLRGSLWTTAALGNTEPIGATFDAVVGPDGVPHVAIRERHQIRYGRRGPEGWEWEEITASVNDGPSIAVDLEGAPHITFEGDGQELWYARRTDDGWVRELVAYGSSSGGDVAIDDFGEPHIVFTHCRDIDCRVYYAAR